MMMITGSRSTEFLSSFSVVVISRRSAFFLDETQLRQLSISYKALVTQALHERRQYMVEFDGMKPWNGER